MGFFEIELGRPFDSAGKSRVLRGESSLPDVSELFQYVGDGVLVGIVVHEHDDAIIVENHLTKRGPLVFVLGNVLGRIKVLQDARVLYSGDKILDVGKVGVADKHCDDFEGVLFQPVGYLLELRLEGTGIEKVTGGVAVVEGSVDPVDLSLDCEGVLSVLVISRL
jgi:hypothetical protein